MTEWVSCDFRLPGIGQEIIFFWEGIKGIAVVQSSQYYRLYTTKLFIHFNDQDLHIGDDISHWMPAPSDPE